MAITTAHVSFTPVTILFIVKLLRQYYLEGTILHPEKNTNRGKNPPSQPTPKNTSCGLGGLLGFFLNQDNFPQRIQSRFLEYFTVTST